MSNNALKTPFGQSLRTAISSGASDVLALEGQSLPASIVSANGSIVTVRFEVKSKFTLPNVTIPLFGPMYIRYPMQPGDKGMVIAADAYLGGMSGLGGGVASLVSRGNLTALVFLPFANTAWSSVDPNATVIYGPNGVVLKDTDANSTFVLTPTSITIVGKDEVVIESGTTTINLSSSGSWSVSGSGNGSLTSGGSLVLSDSSHSTNISLMNSVWTALVAWANTHNHRTSGVLSTPPVVPYTGGNIAP